MSKLIMNSDSYSRRNRRAVLAINPATLSEATSARRETAFTRLELLAVLAVLVLVVGVVLPVLAQGRPRSQQATCFNNLRMVGQAILLFNSESGQTDPWRTPGAGYQTAAGGNIFFQFLFLSNGLANPKVLACPSDASVRPAKDYSQSPDGGFLNVGYRNAAVSYFIGLDSSVLLPNSVLSGDRNIRVASLAPGGCSSGISQAFPIYKDRGSTGWAKGHHAPSGNILLHDGRVEETSSETANRLFLSESDDNGVIHFMFPSLPSL